MPDKERAEGVEAYDATTDRVRAIGSTWDVETLDEMIVDGALEILWDTEGTADLLALAGDLLETEFARERIEEVFATSPSLEPWRVSEAIAETYFVTCRGCLFPWPNGRDLKNPSGSPAGADLVGFIDSNGDSRFAFGEVKSSTSAETPPGVLYGRSGLVAQLESLKDSNAKRDALVKYLGFRAPGTEWEQTFRSALARYVRSSHDFALFGFLVRDVAPSEADLQSRAQALANTHPEDLTIEIRAKYLPEGTLATLTEKVLELARDAGYT